MAGCHITLSDAIGRSHATSPLSNGSNLCMYESQINVNSFPIHFLIVFDRSFAICMTTCIRCLTNWPKSDPNSQDHLCCQALVSHTSSFSRAFDGGAPRVWDRSIVMIMMKSMCIIFNATISSNLVPRWRNSPFLYNKS